MRKCFHCNEEKEDMEFKRGFVCKICIKKQTEEYREARKKEVKEYKKEYRKAHKEEIKKYNKGYQKGYQKEHKEEIKEYQKEYQKAHKEEIKEHKKEYREALKEEIKEYQKEYRKAHKEEAKEYKKEYQKEHKEEIKEHKKEYRAVHKEEIKEHKKYKFKTDINYRISCNLRTRLIKALKYNQQCGSAVRDLGCSINELKQRFESRFYPHPITGEQMTWDNYGSWHIDHIVPLSKFNFSDPTNGHFYFACHYTNLQPLWAKDNLSKGSRYGEKYEHSCN